jgi:hypothetical protein
MPDRKKKQKEEARARAGSGGEANESPRAARAVAAGADQKDGVLRIYPPKGGEHEQRLREVAVAYARGDFGTARRLSAEVMAASHTEEEKGFASEILRRTANDPVALYVGIGCFALFWLIIYLTLWR